MRPGSIGLLQIVRVQGGDGEVAGRVGLLQSRDFFQFGGRFRGVPASLQGHGVLVAGAHVRRRKAMAVSAARSATVSSLWETAVRERLYWASKYAGSRSTAFW